MAGEIYNTHDVVEDEADAFNDRFRQGAQRVFDVLMADLRTRRDGLVQTWTSGGPTPEMMGALFAHGAAYAALERLREKAEEL